MRNPVLLLMLALIAFAQSDRGTITGTVADPAGAVVAAANVEARNPATGAVYPVATSATGNYTLGQLPAGSYEISVTLPGFKKYVRSGLTVQVAQTLRIDIALEVGSASESITVNEAAPLLKTESGELSHNVTGQRMADLPILGIGSSSASSSGIRNPLAVTQLLPGALFIAGSTSTVRINGAPTNSQSMRIEGQDATNGLGQGAGAQTQASVDAIQEFAIQTSNYAAEFGQAGGGVFNMTMKSGTNQFHGTLYDYFVNEALNAGQPFTNSGGKLARPVARRNDWGGTVGGPIWIPRVYNGHDKSFFFFNWEDFRESQGINTNSITVPIQAYRDGNFTRALTNRTLATDPLGRPIPENAVYDPNTQRLAPNGQIIRDQFPNNTIPLARMDPVALKVQALFPQPTSPNLVNLNAIYPFTTDRDTYIPAVKLDHSISSRDKLSFYWSRTHTAAAVSNTTGGAEGLPQPISAGTGTYIDAQIERLSYDRSVTPTLLLHLGAGYQDNFLKSTAATLDYDANKLLGLKGPLVPGAFPQFRGLTSAQGGMNNVGAGGSSASIMQKTTAVASLTWVHNNHTFKYGAETRIEGYPEIRNTVTNGNYTFAAAQSGLPSTQGQNLAGGTVGFPYASFLLGAVDNGNISVPTRGRLGRSVWGFFAQDTWKVTRKLTFDYGMRYDYSTYQTEQYGRLPNFSASTANPTAGGHPGAVIYEGDAPGRCNCRFAKNYPWAFSPRLGAAYQINNKTVLRLGAGISYNATDNNNRATGMVSSQNPFNSSSFGQPAMILNQGLPFTAQDIAWPDFRPGYYPLVGGLTGPPIVIDQNAGRPPRQWMWSLGLQREISKDLVVEASYVGSRGVWWQAPTQTAYNVITPQLLKTYGLDATSAADRTLLNAPLTNAAVIARGFRVPYSGFPTGSTLAQSLRPFPQFSSGLQPYWAPLGATWYDSLQTKITKRSSFGLDFTYAFTWAKELTRGSESDSPAGATGQVNDVFNREVNKYISVYSRPLVSNFAINYTVPKWGHFQSFAGKSLGYALREWQIGTVLTYASGRPILVPAAQNQLTAHLFRGTFANRVPDQPLFTQDLNCHCFDPNTTFVLNPKAWADPAGGTFGTSAAYYNDYRTQRRPQESLSIGRQFRITESKSLMIRAEFSNIFNRTQMNDPTSINALATPTRRVNSDPNSQATAGFGWINTTSVAAGPRQGSIVARFRF